jgi:cystathionine beta-synthase
VARLFDTILDVIGETPLVRLNRVTTGLVPEIYAKLECVNPGGSVKDRIGVAMIEAAEREGRLRPGATIVEATAGNTGVGLALAASVRGYRCVFVLPDKMSEEKISLLRAHGAEVVITRSNVARDDPEYYINVARRLAKEIPGAWYSDQWGNHANPIAHEQTTGPEIWRDTDGKIDAFVGGMGTTGTTTGVGRFLKQQDPNVRVIAVEPEGSVFSGGTPAPYKVEGIGNSYIPEILDVTVIDEYYKISDREAFNTARRLAKEEGILCGGSSGAAVAAAIKYAKRMDRPGRIVVLVPDTGRNYISKFYSDRWMQEFGFWEEEGTATATVAHVLAYNKDVPPLISLPTDAVIADALDLMHRYGISQLPVIENDRAVGSLEVMSLLKLVHDGIDPKNQRISVVMSPPLPEIDQNADVVHLYRHLLAGSGGVLVTAAKAPKAVLTRIDLIDYYTRRRDEVRHESHS